MVETAVRWAGDYLVVDGRPFVVLGAEVHNSSSSTVRAITKSFDTVKALGANTVLAPVAWDLFEPREGEFDTRLIDTMIDAAQARGLRLVPLWFGSWKNAASTYAPGWVKQDPDRFPRAKLSDGRSIEHLTPFAEESRTADARAFAAMMRRIAEVDSSGTVIAVQVENEIGLLGDSRDRGPLAERLFKGDVPAAVITAIESDDSSALHAPWRERGARTAGSWEEVFGESDRTDEAFMAAGFASYAEAVAAAGRAELDVPLFVNAWLDRDSVLDGPVALAGGKRPGQYPSGGPVLPVAAIWEALAPTIDFLAPDMYVDDPEPVFAGYKSRRGRLFVPELRADRPSVPQMFRAIGGHRAMGISPFGVDAYDAESDEATMLRDAFGLLRAAASVIARDTEAPVSAFMLDEQNPAAQFVLGDVTVHVRTTDDWGYVTPVYPGYGIVVADGDGTAYVIGRGFWITLEASDGLTPAFLSATSYELDGDQLVPSLELNGDETASGTLIPYPFRNTGLVPDRAIPTRVPDTGITRIAVYAL